MGTSLEKGAFTPRSDYTLPSDFDAGADGKPNDISSADITEYAVRAYDRGNYGESAKQAVQKIVGDIYCRDPDTAKKMMSEIAPDWISPNTAWGQALDQKTILLHGIYRLFQEIPKQTCAPLNSVRIASPETQTSNATTKSPTPIAQPKAAIASPAPKTNPPSSRATPAPSSQGKRNTQEPKQPEVTFITSGSDNVKTIAHQWNITVNPDGTTTTTTAHDLVIHNPTPPEPEDQSTFTFSTSSGVIRGNGNAPIIRPDRTIVRGNPQNPIAHPITGQKLESTYPNVTFIGDLNRIQIARGVKIEAGATIQAPAKKPLNSDQGVWFDEKKVDCDGDTWAHNDTITCIVHVLQISGEKTLIKSTANISGAVTIVNSIVAGSVSGKDITVKDSIVRQGATIDGDRHQITNCTLETGVLIDEDDQILINKTVKKE